MKKMTVLAGLVLLAAGVPAGTAFATSLTGSGYNYDIPAGAGDITIISFDYTYGTNVPSGQPAFRIRRLNDNGTDSWLGSFNIHSGSFNLDTDYGPYSNGSVSLSGLNHYEFTLDRSNGLWDLAVNGTTIDFLPILTGVSITNNPQPNGDLVTAGVVMPNKFFSDESLESGQNALDLGWATWNGTSLQGNANSGVGGTGAYRLKFLQIDGGSVDNIQVSNVPEPLTMAGVFMGVVGLAGYIRKRRMA